MSTSCNTPAKWIPKYGSEIIKLFNNCKKIEFELRLLTKKFSTNINLDLLDYYEFQNLIDESRNYFHISYDLQINLNNHIINSSSSALKKLQRNPYKILLQKKATIMMENLRRRHYQLIFVINRMVKSLFDICYQSEIIMESALILCNLYNEIIDEINKNENINDGISLTTGYGTKICSNTFPVLLLQSKKIDIGIILQISSKTRSEQCCISLISCLLTTCKLELLPLDNNNDDGNNSDSSSIQILRTLTAHMTSPKDKKFNNNNSNQIIMMNYTNFATIKNQNNNNGDNNNPNSNNEKSKNIISNNSTPERKFINPSYTMDFDPNDPAIHFFDNLANELFEKNTNQNENYHQTATSIKDEILEHLITSEEMFITEIISKCCKLCPNAFDKFDTKDQNYQKWINRGIRSLWTQIGSTLDHIILWWSDAPLCCRSPLHAKQLREWLMLLNEEDAPEPILSTLKGLGETLTMYVTTTIWDQKFRLTLVSSTETSSEEYLSNDVDTGSSLYLEDAGTFTGNLWCELLCTLTKLCNSCDQNGTIPTELPIVEQIPILHRLDHSVHSMRLWIISKAKSLCSEWNMGIFFKIIHHDIRNCLEQLQYLRFPELIPIDAIEVLIQVCVVLRYKLISEIKINILKLKNTCNECIDILASTCRTYTLATLSLCFPCGKEWKINVRQENCGEYVNYFLKQIYLPILKATNDIEILSLGLKIICESWLDHIYLKRIKFSRCGAINLLKDFDGVAEWIKNCNAIQKDHIEKLSKHEVLRMCEGVGRILLRKPDDIVSILPSPSKYKRQKNDEETEGKAQLPPEMFVPNQKRWLELRARGRGSSNFKYCFCICNGIEVEN